jgi:hypothetical protein
MLHGVAIPVSRPNPPAFLRAFCANFAGFICGFFPDKPDVCARPKQPLSAASRAFAAFFAPQRAKWSRCSG